MSGARRVCVLGGTGFVGRRLAARLARSDWQLRVPTRSSARPDDLRVLPNVQVLTADIQDPETLAELVGDCEAVVNLVGILNEKGYDGSGFRRVHVELIEKLLAACDTAGVSRLVQISALAADARGGSSHYLRSKGEAEELIQAHAGSLGWTILRPSVIFGPGDSFLNRFAGLLRLLPGPFPLARANSLFAPVHVDDVAAAIQLGLEERRTDGQCYELCGPEVYTLRELVQMTAGAIGRRRRIVGLPDGIAKLQARIMERLPGKAFTMDNYRSLTVPSLCTSDGLDALGIRPLALSVSLPEVLGMPREQVELNTYRQLAGR
jgi:NADH dehydrogenase